MTAAEFDLSYQHQPDCKDLGHIPGDNGWPIVGKTPALIKDFKGLVNDHVNQYGHISRVGLGFQRGLLITHPDHLKEIYLDRDRNFSPKMGYNETLGRFYTNGLLMRDWDDHKAHRRMFQNSFKNNAMRGYVELMNPVLEQGMGNWGEIPNFLFFPNIKETLLAMAARVFLGIEDMAGDEIANVNQAFADINESGLMAIVKKDIPGLKFHTGLRGRRFMIDYFLDLIPKRRSGDGKDTMSILVKEKDDQGNYFSDMDIVNHLNFLLFAAHDTTTSALNHILMYLGRPEYMHMQDRLREEAKEIGNDYMSYEDLDRSDFLDNVIHEGLRMHPSVSMMTRRTVRECQLGGYRIPANTMMFISPHWAHYSEDYWTNPNKFDPDRFSPERAENKTHPFGFVGFGGGMHKCIGMHFALMTAKLFMHQFIQKYRFYTPENYNPWMQTVPLPKPGDDLPLRLERI